MLNEWFRLKIKFYQIGFMIGISGVDLFIIVQANKFLTNNHATPLGSVACVLVLGTRHM